MKTRISLTFLMMLLACTFVFAQAAGKGKKTPEEKAQKKADKMAEVMGLDDSQKAAVYEANLQAINDLKPIREAIKAKYPTKDERKANKDAIKEEFKPQMKPIKNARKEAIKEVVSEEQWQTWKDYRKANKGNGGDEDDMMEDDDE
jgi:arginyl-tRNA--protein-N-Asp/Glu arginylyltransferase